MSTQVQPPTVSRELEAQVLRMFVGGASQFAVSRHFALSKSTVSRLINGIYPFTPTSGKPAKDLAALREAVTKRCLGDNMRKCVRGIKQMADAMGVVL